MKLTRASGGGRKPAEVVNTVRSDEITQSWFTDIIVGCIRCMKAEVRTDTKLDRKEFVGYEDLVELYNVLPVFTTADILDHYRNLSTSSAKRYMQVIKLAQPFIERYKRNIATPTMDQDVQFQRAQRKYEATIDIDGTIDSVHLLCSTFSTIKAEFYMNLSAHESKYSGRSMAIDAPSRGTPMRPPKPLQRFW